MAKDKNGSQPLSGKISDRLRRELDPKDKSLNPERPGMVAPKGGKDPKGVEGHSMTGRTGQRKMFKPGPY